MKFEDLKQFFDTEKTFVIHTNSLISAQYIKFANVGISGDISFYDYGLGTIPTEIFYGKASESICFQLKNIINSASNYFAKIIKAEKQEIIVSIISFNKIISNSPIYIGVSELNGTSSTECIKQFKETFFFQIGNRSFYIRGKYKDANTNIFSLIGVEEKVDVIQCKRRELVATSDVEAAEDMVFAIRKKPLRYKKEDYIYEICENNIEFQSGLELLAISKRNEVENLSNSENIVLNKWEMYTEKEYELFKRKVENAGTLFFFGFTRLEDDNIEFAIHSRSLFNMNSFIECVEMFKTDALLEIYKNDNPNRAIAKVLYVARTMDNKKIICKTNDSFKEIPSDGYIKISLSSEKSIHDRRMSAIQRIRNNQAAKEGLALLLMGKPMYVRRIKKRYRVEDFREEIERAFHGRQPNSSQKEAIELAINTPDFAIIQGPPGCGKTALINAIDYCLAKIDTPVHRMGASLSTAYQNDSTENMIAGKEINGVPVPFISKSRSVKKYVESNFKDYIEEIQQKLAEKYPEIIKELNNSFGLKQLTAIQADFVVEKTTLHGLIQCINTIFSHMQDVLEIAESNALEKIRDKARKKLEKRQHPNNLNGLQYIRMIPSSIIEYEDDGYNTFLEAKELLLKECSDLSKDIFEHLERISKNLMLVPIDFERIKEIKDEMIFILKNNREEMKSNLELNQEVDSILESIKNRIDKKNEHDDEFVLKNFIDIFMNNELHVRQALSQWVTSIAATHQISGDAKMVSFDNDSSQKEDSFVAYNNVLIDEAARSCPPDLFIPISCAKQRIIMVGDQKQLPQFVDGEILDEIDLSDDLKKDMKTRSMFEYLFDDVAPKLTENDGFQRVISLNEQYRMPKVLGDFIGDNFYPNLGLKSPRGNPNQDEGFKQSLPYITNKCLVWCDSFGTEEKEGKGRKNIDEAKVVAKLLYEFLHDENEENAKLSIGVISFYRGQVKEIKKQLYELGIAEEEKGTYRINSKYEKRVKIDTVDSFQGLQKDIIILSMVISDERRKFAKNAFGFLDGNRLCVALSRQQRCLIVVGNGEGMLKTSVAEKRVKALANCYKLCKKGGDYIGFIQSKDILQKRV